MAAPMIPVVRPSNWNLPNLITAVRILMAPVFLWMLLAAEPDSGLRWAAAIVFIIAIATDGIDGAIARKHNLVTDLGKILDPIADKVLTGAALVCLSIIGELPAWVTVIILVREIGITVFRFVMLRDRVIPASRGGKLKTIAQSVAISLALLPFNQVFESAALAINVLNTGTMAIALLLTVLSGLDYLAAAAREARQRRHGA